MRSIPALPFARSLPPLAGIGLKPCHYGEVLGQSGDVPHPAGAPAWVEVHPQNYFADGGPAHRWLGAVAEVLPLSFHSTGLSLGSAEGPCPGELEALARLVERYQPAQVSDHLSWSVSGADRFPDLLPMPYDEMALERLCANIWAVQDRLRRPILIENPSRYLAFAGDTMDEAAFLRQLCRQTGCSLLLDINNIAVSANNLGLDATAMVDAIDPALVGEVHLAGHACEDHGDFILAIDDHGSPVAAETWALFARFIARAGAVPTLIEWDTDVPDYAVLMCEATKAGEILAAAEAANARAA